MYINDPLTKKLPTVYKSSVGNRVVHFEIEAKDLTRAKKFYSQALGWEMNQMGEDMGKYVMVITGDRNEPGGINGGMFENKNKELNAYSCVIAVDDIESAMADVSAAGGKVLSEKPDDIPGVGLYAKCEDTEGNRFTLLKPSSDMPQGA